ncbi:MAG: Asp-tRNA(Asn)/Glu-tRNA(Gln) amidotransferase subunit GatC [Anaerolineae bacterium]|nr:MAG: Asp-tRNA(Asn)/Glu-tRNA(Gln) amidotransferase subunit GatC [Anaerolineae bacterium]
MKLTLQEVEHIAALARLRLTDEEKAAYREQLSAVLEYVARLQALDTEGIPPTSSVQPAQTPLRPDHVEAPMPREKLLANAPAVQDGQFRVPPVLEE